MPQWFFSEVHIPQSLRLSAFLPLLFAALRPPDLAWAQALGSVQGIADMFVDFLASTCTRSITIVGWAVCGFMATAGRLPGGACLVLTGSRLSFGGSVLPEIPFLLRRRV